jgi:hypothetical protein
MILILCALLQQDVPIAIGNKYTYRPVKRTRPVHSSFIGRTNPGVMLVYKHHAVPSKYYSHADSTLQRKASIVNYT